MSEKNKQAIQDVPFKIVIVPSPASSTYLSDIDFPNIEIVSNEDMPTHIEFLMNEIQYNDLCKGLNKKYINESLTSDKTLFFMYIIKTKAPRTIEGLAIIQKKDTSTTNTNNNNNIKKDILFIDILCGSNRYSGTGSLLMDIVETIGKKHNINSINLNSVTTSIGFYIKKGFRCNKNYCRMTHKLKGGKRRTRRSKK